jgi:hypothetical protein
MCEGCKAGSLCQSYRKVCKKNNTEHTNGKRKQNPPEDKIEADDPGGKRQTCEAPCPQPKAPVLIHAFVIVDVVTAIACDDGLPVVDVMVNGETPKRASIAND